MKIKKLETNNWKQLKIVMLNSRKNDDQAYKTKYRDLIIKNDEYWKQKLTDQNNTYFAAFDNNKPIGIIRLTFNDNEEPHDVAIIGSFYVKKEYRKQGIGKSLMQKAINLSNQNKSVKTTRLYVKQTQIPAINLYKSLGFKKASFEENKYKMDLKNKAPDIIKI